MGSRRFQWRSQDLYLGNDFRIYALSDMRSDTASTGARFCLSNIVSDCISLLFSTKYGDKQNLNKINH